MRKTETIKEQTFTPLEGDHLFKEFVEMAKHFHGYPAPGVILGCYIGNADLKIPKNSRLENGEAYTWGIIRRCGFG